MAVLWPGLARVSGLEGIVYGTGVVVMSPGRNEIQYTHTANVDQSDTDLLTLEGITFVLFTSQFHSEEVEFQ